jgi:post-segregation antitoxin (ccd killing protein)
VTITIQIPDEIAREAQARGMDVSTYVSGLLEHAVERSSVPPAKRLTREEFEAALDRLARFSHEIPNLPLEALGREHIYEDRD